MKRGDIVTVSAPGDYGKPRPAVIVQSDLLNELDSVLVALMTSKIADTLLYRVQVEPQASNGLKLPSQIMVDKILAYPRAKCGAVIGFLDRNTLTTLNGLLAVVIGLAD
jgi:mRNA interferase MazF